jgi:hypothetical protein
MCDMMINTIAAISCIFEAIVDRIWSSATNRDAMRWSTAHFHIYYILQRWQNSGKVFLNFEEFQS